MAEKLLLVLERSESQLSASQSGKSYVLEGVFTEFGVRNKNGRIYEEADIMPHIELLQKKIAGGRLIGELDHPKSFELSFKNASHVIESMTYDKDKRQVIGRIRLLNTTCGKEAQALLEGGVPLYISSRSAGVVENSGHVKLRRMFTYDLVADPGFVNAELSEVPNRVNESYGFTNDDTIQLFDVPGSDAVLEDKTAPAPMEEFISRADFNAYTKLVKEGSEKAHGELAKQLKELNEALAAVKKGTGDAAAAGTGDTARLEVLENLVKEQTSTIKNLISHNDYIIENLERVTSYSELIAKSVTEEAADKADMDKVIGYSKMLAEKLDESIGYIKYVVQEENNRWKYQAMVNEHTDALITHADYIVESVDSVIRFADHVSENVSSLGASLDVLDTKINGGVPTIVAAPEAPVSEKREEPAIDSNVTEEVPTSEVKTNAESTVIEHAGDIAKKLESMLLESNSQQGAEADSPKPPFYGFLSKENRERFDSMETDAKGKVLEAFKVNKYYGSVDVARIWEASTTDAPKELNWLTDAPEKYKPIWESLSPDRKNAIRAQAKVRNLRTEYQIENFWATRELRPYVPKLVDESVNSAAAVNEADAGEDPSKYRTNSAWMASVEEGLKARFGK